MITEVTGPSASPRTPGVPAQVRRAVKPTFPSVAKKRTQSGAEAFVRYYVEALDYSWTKPDPTLIANLGLKTCNSCQTLLATAEEMLEREEKYFSRTAEVDSVSFVLSTATEMRFLMKIHQLRSQRRSATGDLIEDAKDKSLTRIIAVEWEGAGWKVSLIGEP